VNNETDTMRLVLEKLYYAVPGVGRTEEYYRARFEKVVDEGSHEFWLDSLTVVDIINDTIAAIIEETRKHPDTIYTPITLRNETLGAVADKLFLEYKWEPDTRKFELLDRIYVMIATTYNAVELRRSPGPKRQ